jgi:hypothetical protein
MTIRAKEFVIKIVLGVQKLASAVLIYSGLVLPQQQRIFTNHDFLL